MTNPSDEKRPHAGWKWLHWTMIGWVLWRAFSLRWLSDDAFISFRYAKHFTEGHGLVYNVGEYVEGYTNLLWTLVLGVGMTLGVSPETGAHLLSLGGLVGMMWLLMGFVGTRGWSLSLLLIAAMFHVQIFATSGLETQWFEAFIVLAMWAVWTSRWRVAQVAMVLGMLTRPEGGLIWMALMGVGFMDAEAKKQRLSLLLTGAVTLIGLGLWRWFYYGELLPNTFYAKASAANWAQGWLYVRLFFQMYWFVPLGWICAVLQLKHDDPSVRRLGVFTLLFSTIFCLHVLQAGGDFMMARFALPWALPLIISLSVWVQERMANIPNHWVVPLLGVVIASTAVEPAGLNDISDGQFGIQGITNEHIWYTEEWRQKAVVAGEAVQPFLQDTNIQVVIYGAQAMFAYYAELPYALEGMSGLTDYELARLPSRDGRVGHGRKATVPYLQARGVELYLDFRLNQQTHPLNQIQLGPVSGSILSYKRDTMALLRQRGAEFQDFPEYLEWYLSQMSSKPTAMIQNEMNTFQHYYFQFNQTLRDLELQRLIAAQIAED